AAPPRALDAVPAALHLHLHGRDAMAQVVLTPGRAGPNAVEIGLVGVATPPLEVKIAFADPARGVEPIRLAAVRDGSRWRAGPVQLPHGGEWAVTVEVLVSAFAKETLETTATVGE
ncbi:MAG TPA: copper resistance protein CopC, partial [Amaricoccus sp.]|nr:copper resistance protein CopC [Amaricoccus sp.]